MKELNEMEKEKAETILKGISDVMNNIEDGEARIDFVDGDGWSYARLTCIINTEVNNEDEEGDEETPPLNKGD